jgi:hypothetical protein
MKTNRNWQEYSNLLDWDKIFADIKLNDVEDLSLVTQTISKVDSLGNYFVPYDMDCFTILDIEQTIVKDIDGIKDKSIIDLIVEIKPDAGKPYNSYVGKRLGIDWKSSRRALDTEWKFKHINSWQWKRYAFAANLDLFEYRGCGAQGEFRPIILEVPEENTKLFIEDYRAKQAQKKNLIENYKKVGFLTYDVIASFVPEELSTPSFIETLITMLEESKPCLYWNNG